MIKDNIIETAFNIESIETEINQENLPTIPIDVPEKSRLITDYEQARINTYNLINKGVDALNAALEFAKKSEKANSYESVAILISQLSRLNDQLLELNLKISDSKEPAQKTNITNNLIVTKDLNKLIEGFLIKDITDAT